MKVNTSRQFRKKHLNDYHFYDFENFEDYFLYLHLNTRVQWVHLLGALVSVPLLPWSLYVLFYQYNPLPFLAYTAIFYGAGFSIHWASDGLISKTVASFGPSFFYVMILNFRLFTGTMASYEAQYIQKYPHTLWVYQDPPEAPSPEALSQGREVNYPFWLKGLFVLLTLGGVALTQLSSLLWLGWGLLYLVVFMLIGFPCVLYLQKHNDSEALLKTRVGDWGELAIALAKSRKAHPESDAAIFALQKTNTEFWLAWKSNYLKALRLNRPAEQEILEQEALSWKNTLAERIDKQEWQVSPEQAPLGVAP